MGHCKCGRSSLWPQLTGSLKFTEFVAVSPPESVATLLALRDLCEAQRLGGKTHLGWGGVTAQRFRYVHGAERHDLFEMVPDDEGLPVLRATPAFDKLCEPAVKALDAIAKAPAQERDRVRALLNA